MFAAIQAAFSIASTFLQVVRVVLPDVIALVGDVQKAFPPETPTAHKVAHVEDILKVALADVQGLPVSAGDILPALLAVAERHFESFIAPAAPTVDGATA